MNKTRALLLTVGLCVFAAGCGNSGTTGAPTSQISTMDKQNMQNLPASVQSQHVSDQTKAMMARQMAMRPGQGK